jgi:hypothetical protein
MDMIKWIEQVRALPVQCFKWIQAECMRCRVVLHTVWVANIVATKNEL